MEFSVLGPLNVRADDGHALSFGAGKPRLLLSILLLNANKVVADETLIEYLWWGRDPPRSALANVRTHVNTIRRLVGRASADRSVQVMTRPGGYRLELDADQLDLARWQRLVVEGRAALARNDLRGGERLLQRALALWRGRAFEDLDPQGPLQGAIADLEQQRIGALEDQLDARLRLGDLPGLADRLGELVRDHPWRERLAGLLMVALHQSGRPAEALAVYREFRERLVEELGLEPSPTLQDLERRLLVNDPALDLSAPATSRKPTQHLVPSTLPAVIADFTGRTTELSRLKELVTHPPPIQTRAVVIWAIVGSAGVGKTALAVRFAHEIRSRFPDGQLYIDLRGHDPSPPLHPIQALATLLHALGVYPKQIPAEQDRAVGMYRSLLADKRVLVVLDNAGSPEQVRLLLPTTPGCLAVVTSRDRLSGLVAHDGAHRITLGVLAPAEAHELLARMLGVDRVQAEPAATAELARACSWLPLALRIAAANLTDRPEQSIADYTVELRKADPLAALTLDGGGQGAVSAAFDLSFRRLTSDASQLFRLLGLSPGVDVTAEAAAALANLTVEEAARLLDQLAGAHLLDRQARGRFAFHDLLRHFAAQRAHDDSDSDRALAVQRLYGYYLHGTDAAARLLYPGMVRLPLPGASSPPRRPAFGDDRQALAWLDAERANLVAAIQQAAAKGPQVMAWLLADALRGYFYLRRHMVDWLAVAQAAQAAGHAAGVLSAQAAAQLSLADAHQLRSRYPEAIRYYRRAVVLSRQTGWLDGEATALGNLGRVHWERGRLEQAAEHFTRALALDRQTGSVARQAVRLGNLGAVCFQLGRLQQAADHYERALALSRKAGSRSDEAIALGNLGEANHALAQLDDAAEHLDRALALARETGNRGQEADTLRVLANVHGDLGRHADALELAQAALTLARDTGDRHYQADALNTVASVHACQRDHRAAIEYHQQALRLAHEAGVSYARVEALIGLTSAHWQVGQPGQARSCGRRALNLACQAGYQVLEGQTLTALAELHCWLDQPDQAIDYAQRALAIQTVTGHRLGQARTLVVLGRGFRDSHSTDAAVAHWQKALALFTEIGIREADQIRHLIDATS